MPWPSLLGILGGIALVGFIIFAFRQGMQVKPDPENKPPNINAP
jgi:hypothetical protein